MRRPPMGSLGRRLLLVACLFLLTHSPVDAEPRSEKGSPPRTDRYGDPLPEGAVARLGTVRLRQSEPVTALAFSPDGKVLASGGRDDGVVHLWDATTGKELRRFLGHKRPPNSANARSIHSIAFFPDGKTVASVSGDSLRLWDAGTGKESRQFGERGAGVCLALSPDGKLLASAGGWDKQLRLWVLRLWEASSGKELGQLSGHEGIIMAAAFSADGRTLASGD